MKSKSHVNWIVITFITLLLLYIISFGPVIFALSKLSVSEHSFIGRVAWVIYQPHFHVAYHSDLYFRYALWFAGGHGDHATFRKSAGPKLGYPPEPEPSP